MNSRKSNGTHILLAFQELQANVQLYHWLTTSHARHVASDKLYKSLIDHIDRFMETFMGSHGRPSMSKTAFEVKHMTDSEFVQYLQSNIDYFQNKLPSLIGKNDTHLLNIRDEIVADINQTLYLCTLR